MSAISVIVPVYKVEPFLNRCVDSILNQSFSDFDLILVDDGSPDCCGEICDQYAQKDARVHVVHQENGGLSAARNAGIDWAFANSGSRWLAFVDSDDWVHRDYLKVLLSEAEKNQAQISICDYVKTDVFLEDGAVSGYPIEVLAPEDAYIKRYGMCMMAWCKLYDKKLFSHHRFPVGKLHEDAYITHELVFQAERIVAMDVPLYYYYGNPESITRAKWKPSRLDQIEAHALRLDYLKEKNFTNAYVYQIRAYTVSLYEQLEQLEQQGGMYAEENQPYIRLLQKKLRAALRLAGRYNLFPLRTSLGIYKVAYPADMVWSVLHKIKRLFR